MLRRVAGGGNDREVQPADLDRVALADAAVLVPEPSACADHVVGAGRGGQVPSSRDVVVVQVGLEDMGDPQVEAARLVEIDIDVAPGVDDGGEAGRFVADEGGQMPEAVNGVLADQHPPRVAPDPAPDVASPGRRGMSD